MVADATGLPQALEELIAARYGRAVRPIASIAGGDEAVAWRVDGEEQLLVHQSPRWRTAEELAWVHELIAIVARDLPETVAPVRTRDGSTFVTYDTALITLYPFIEGEHLDRHDASQRDAAATLLARLHRVTFGCSMPPRPAPGPGALAVMTGPADPPELMDRDLDAQIAGLERRPDLAWGLIHGDFYRRNLIWSGGRIAAVVDWHEARHDALVGEVARAAWEFGKDAAGTHLIAKRARAFLERYRSAAGPAEVQDLRLLVPLIRSRLREEARLSLKLAARGLADDTAYRAAVIASFVSLREQSL